MWHFPYVSSNLQSVSGTSVGRLSCSQDSVLETAHHLTTNATAISVRMLTTTIGSLCNSEAHDVTTRWHLVLDIGISCLCAWLLPCRLTRNCLIQAVLQHGIVDSTPDGKWYEALRYNVCFSIKLALDMR